MEKTFKNALETALQQSGRSLRSVAIAAGVSYEQLKALRQGKSQKTNVDDALKVARAFGVTLDDFYAGQLTPAANLVAVAGKVGAGAVVHLVDAYAKGGGMYFVQCPRQLSPRGVVAVEVTGDSMEPVYSEGDILFYSRPTAEGVPSEAVGRKCIVEDLEGRIWVKQLKIGEKEGFFSLISINSTGANMHNVGIRWAAHVRMDLPYDLVERIYDESDRNIDQ